jgi:hypothetical protein
VFNEAVRDSILDSGITTKYEWVTSTAERVCKICRPLNGRVFDATRPVATTYENIGQKTKAGNIRVPLPVNSTHPNCRCMIVPKIDLLKQ